MCRISTTNFGTINVRGIQTKEQKETLVQDLIQHGVEFCSITEHHIPKQEDLFEIGPYIIYTVNEENSQMQTCTKEQNK